MDFVEIKEKINRNGVTEIYPNFLVRKSKDIMTRGKGFYAVWDDENKMWSTDEYSVARLVDEKILKRDAEVRARTSTSPQTLYDFNSGMWTEFNAYINSQPDFYKPLDEKLTFINTKVKREDFVSKRLEYPLEAGGIDAYDELIGTLYIPEERAKLEWAIGSIIAGDSKNIQKFIVLYGSQGAGKSTILNIIQQLFKGYYTTFEAKSLTSSNNSFATEVFKSNPLVAIQHDGDLSKIEDNSKLNSIVSHEEMTMNEKYKASYTSKINSFLFMGTNKPVKITDAKSGLIRRLIDVVPSGVTIPTRRYHELIGKVDFELGGIAQHCLDVYLDMGKSYYSDYKPISMMMHTDVFFNFVESNFTTFKEENGITLTRAYDLYKLYCDESIIEFKLPKHKFREELKNYFGEFHDMTRIDGKQIRSYYHIFLSEKFTNPQQNVNIEEYVPVGISLDSDVSAFEVLCKDHKAQYASGNETPLHKWDDVTTNLEDLDTRKLHYVAMPENHIVIDFDLKDESGEKSYALNMEAANLWPPTYTELSKSEKGVHLHYLYDGDVSKLSRVFDANIEVKVFVGNSSLRRKLTKCNNLEVATINSGLPLKGVEKMINFEGVKNEKAIRTIIKKNLNKEYHAGTKSSVDFIDKTLTDAYNSGMNYDVTDLRPAILAFGNNSSNNAMYCIKLVNKMKFKSENQDEVIADTQPEYVKDELVFFDVEVFPNLFVIVWKYAGENKPCVRMINPKAADIEGLLQFKLVGFNCRRYDNHILYARYLGYDNRQLYELSQRIINGSENCLFGDAYNISYTDVYDFASAVNKKGLKKFEIELGIHHQELGLPWDQIVPQVKWMMVAEYCDNDVIATEAVFNHLAGDWTARKILAKLSGLTVNDTTNKHSGRIIFGDNKHPQDEFIYTDLSEMFHGYTFENNVSMYRGIEVGEGGYVYSEPGMYGDVAVLDVASMHPTSMEQMNLFGTRYTDKFSEIKNARLAIKHEDYDSAKKMMDGKLAEFLNDSSVKPADLSNALKTVINSVYGLTSAKFTNLFRDPRNIDNIVAKRGALFMIDLKFAVEKKGFIAAHIKTDSIKIPDATPEIIDFVMDFGTKYGYDFEHEATYDKMCLVNDAVYIAKYKWAEKSRLIGTWSATGAQFAQPYVFKTLFTKEKITFKDVCETKAVTSSLYLDMNEGFPDVSDYEKKLDNWNKKHTDSFGVVPGSNTDQKEDLTIEILAGHNYHFVGKTGEFCPMKPGCGGGLLVREKDGKYYSVAGSKGYRWLESEVVKVLGKESDIDYSYYAALCDKSVDAIDKYRFDMLDFHWFTSDQPYRGELKSPF